jgi:phosphatidylserine/phosphatidylglycerophosphate/cardiolipin synthase-like enzyme
MWILDSIKKAMGWDHSQPILLTAKLTKDEVYFAPHADAVKITDVVVSQINTAEKTIRVQAYDFSSLPIATALVEAHKRGVDVQVIIDKWRCSLAYCAKGPLLDAGIKVFSDGKHHIAHNKVIVVDEKVVLTGSFNWTEGAEANAENLVLLHNPVLIDTYAKNWELHLAHSVPATKAASFCPDDIPDDLDEA